VSNDVAENGMFPCLQFAIVCRRLYVKRRYLERIQHMIYDGHVSHKMGLLAMILQHLSWKTSKTL